MLDFILTYKYRVESKKRGKKNSEEEIKKSSENRKRKRDSYFENLAKAGFEFEEQDPKVRLITHFVSIVLLSIFCGVIYYYFISIQYYDGDTTFVKVHATFKALAKGAEELLIRMPITVRYYSGFWCKAAHNHLNLSSH